MPELPNRPVRVLVVDDDRDSATNLSALLMAAGFEVRTAFDGPGALAVAQQFHPDACILDIGMPGMDGYELARRLRADAPAIRVLATVTGYGDDLHLDRAADAGFDLHFTKPIDVSEVIDQLSDCVSR